MVFMRTKENLEKLKEIGKKIKKLEDNIDRQLMEMNAGFSIHVEATMGGFDWDEWPTDGLRSLAEEYVADQKALGISIAGVEELLAVLSYREQEEKES